ncbi:hypothetical protein NGC32_03535 [Kluyvera cryocrescens]|uniref:hypothetical protein n=1 Tax=Kluyvera cryocrescens TaxID=580 RepID=UPI002DBED409|nr:hypothetical protein [Kluyvera cryocrescens]MEB7711794.1 hypothetical protein [Kluyvera cryocrescens]
MNDITALAQREMKQREKFEAWTEESCALPWGYLKKRRTYDGFYSEHTYTSLWAAWKAASMELVEALEKAQQTEKKIKSRNRRLEGIISVAEQRISELESRTVTVKLPAVEKWRKPDAVRAQNAYRVLVINDLAAAGINVEVE